MKKHLTFFIRLLIAVAGLAYIGWIIDWTDHVELASGVYKSSSAAFVELASKTTGKVIRGRVNPKGEQTETLAIELNLPRQGQSQIVELSQNDFSGQNKEKIKVRPGIITTLREADIARLLLGLLVIAPIYPITALRWWMLLRARGLDVSPWQAFRLSMVGCFFNYCMPGSTGGDVIKAYYTAKNSSRRADSVMTVIIDRIVGLLGLFVLAGIAGLFIEHDSAVQKITRFVWIIASGVVLVSALYFSRRLRQASGLEWLLTKILPEGSLIGKIDAAAVAYSYHKMTVLGSILASLPVHLLLAISTSLAGWALGMTTPFPTLLAVIPIVFLVMAIPISPQGVGTTEFIAIRLLHHAPYATANQVIVMFVLARLYQLIYSLAGAVFLLKGDIHLHPDRQEKSVEEVANPSP